MNTSGMFTLNWKDVGKGLVVAVISGIVLPVAAAIQTPGFDVTNVNLHGLLLLAANGAVVGFVSYLVKNYFSNSQGQAFGRIG